MDIVTQKQRYIPHEISTRVSAVKAYRETRSIGQLELYRKECT